MPYDTAGSTGATQPTSGSDTSTPRDMTVGDTPVKVVGPDPNPGTPGISTGTLRPVPQLNASVNPPAQQQSASASSDEQRPLKSAEWRPELKPRDPSTPPAPMPAPDAVPPHLANKAGWFNSIATAMGGGPKYKLDPVTGQMNEVTPKTETFRQKMGVLAAMMLVLGGASASGMSEHGPGSVGRSVQKGAEFMEGIQKQRTEQNEQTIKLANQKRQVVESTFKMHQMAMEMTLRSNEWNQATATAGMDTLDNMRKDGYASAIKYPMVSEKELPQYMKEFGTLQPVLVRYIPHEPVQQADGSWKEEHEAFFALVEPKDVRVPDMVKNSPYFSILNRDQNIPNDVKMSLPIVESQKADVAWLGGIYNDMSDISTYLKEHGYKGELPAWMNNEGAYQAYLRQNPQTVPAILNDWAKNKAGQDPKDALERVEGNAELLKLFGGRNAIEAMKAYRKADQAKLNFDESEGPRLDYERKLGDIREANAEKLAQTKADEKDKRTPVYAEDKDGKLILTNRYDAEHTYQSPEKAIEEMKPSDIAKDRSAMRQLGDVQVNTTRYVQSIANDLPYVTADNRDRMREIIALNQQNGGDLVSFGEHGFSLNIPVISAKLNKKNYEQLSFDLQELAKNPHAMNLMNGYYRTAASVPAYQKAVAQSSRPNKEMLELELANVPLPYFDGNTAKSRMDAFQENIDRASTGFPTNLPGMVHPSTLKPHTPPNPADVVQSGNFNGKKAFKLKDGRTVYADGSEVK